MRTIRAIFIKQARDTLKNRMTLVQFIIFPVMAFVMTALVAKPTEDIADSAFVTMFAAMFAGMTPLMMTNSAIAEDKEHKSLRFLVMAGVKPYQYLFGIGGFVLVSCALVAVAFGLIGEFSGMALVKFIFILVLGSVASVVLGASIGIFSKNQQAATAIGTPIFMVLAFCPMLSIFNETISDIASPLYTQQVNLIVNESDMSITTKPLLIILANIAVLFVLFILAYKKKGLKG
jgi:ABC-2 type transport system permease protein